MRVLFTTQPASGHLHPLIPLAQALVRAGHEVKFACSPSFCPTVEASGFPAIPAGLDWLESAFGAAFPQIQEVSASQGTAAALNWVNEEVFADATAEPMATELLALSRNWRPDVIVRDLYEFGGYIAAEALGLPHATVEVGAFRGAFWRDEGVAQHLARLRVAHDLAPDPELARLYHFLHLSFVPPRYQDPAAPLPLTAHALRWVLFDRSGDEELPPWMAHLSDDPTVYVTLGTVANRQPAIFSAIITGLRDEPLNLIVTVGRNQDPADFGPNRRTSTSSAISRSRSCFPPAIWSCRTLVSTASWRRSPTGYLRSSFRSAPINRTMRAGVRALAWAELSNWMSCRPRWCARRCAVLADPAYRENAARLRDEMAALPGPEHGVGLLERLVTEKQPLVSA